jgi:hypothetical protein
MTNALWATLVPALVIFLTAAATYIQARQAVIVAQSAVDKVREVGTSVDGRMGQLLANANLVSHAAGVIDGRLQNLEKANGGISHSEESNTP